MHGQRLGVAGCRGGLSLAWRAGGLVVLVAELTGEVGSWGMAVFEPVYAYRLRFSHLPVADSDGAVEA